MVYSVALCARLRWGGGVWVYVGACVAADRQMGMGRKIVDCLKIVR